jgi:thymidylate synthase
MSKLFAADSQYLNLCRKVLAHGEQRQDRTGTGTLSIFSHQMQFDMADGFPLLTTKDMSESFKHIVAEMLWILSGSTNANDLADMGFSIWRKWADGSGELGPVYGFQWRNFNGATENPNEWFLKGVDQIAWILDELRTNPYSRRMVVSAWNPNQISQMALPPCHWSFELYVDFSKNTLNMKLHQRSCDVFLGVPYNIAEYALLLHMFSKVSGYTPGILVHDMTNVHIYNDHIEQVKEQITRYPYELPELIIQDRGQGIFDFTMDDFSFSGYKHHPKLSGKVSV